MPVRLARPSATRVAATRAARSGSPGQPITVSRSARATGPWQRAATSRPRPCRSEPSKRDWPPETPADPVAGSGSRHPAADHRHPGCSGQASQRRRARTAAQGPDVEHRLVPGPRLAVGHRGVGRTLDLGRRQPPPTDARQHPRHVRVDDGDVALEGEREHRSGRVRPDAREAGRARGTIDGKTPTVLVDDRGRRRVQPGRPAVVAEAGPLDHDVADRRRGAGGDRREPGEERVVRGTTRGTWVCWSITSLTRTAQGSRVRRHGRSRRSRSAQLRTASWSSGDTSARRPT